ncbi:MAG: dephospho-CoA kinase [Bacteroidetes bacterium]|jgi:dephospho-CoA kinase|nr:dephospho-CoA kinase [Bacteroidota bacterium]
MEKIAITGNMGSGKSSCCKILALLGYPIYYADERAKFLMSHDSKLKMQISKEFGAKSYSGKKLNAKYLANRVFNDEKALQKLNALVHPAVGRDVQNWMQNKQKKGYKAAFEEAALTFEANHQNNFDKIITVAAPEALLINRVVKRDGSSKFEVQKRLSRQINQKQKCQQSNAIILNDGQHSLIFQLLNIVRRWNLS